VPSGLKNIAFGSSASGKDRILEKYEAELISQSISRFNLTIPVVSEIKISLPFGLILIS